MDDYKDIVDYDDSAQRKTVLLVKYNENDENNPIEIVWKSNKFTVENVGYGLYKVSDVTDFRKVFIYDILNLSKIELDV